MCYCDSLTLSHRKLTPFVWNRNNILRIRPFPPKSFVCVNLFQYIKIYFLECVFVQLYILSGRKRRWNGRHWPHKLTNTVEHISDSNTLIYIYGISKKRNYFKWFSIIWLKGLFLRLCKEKPETMMFKIICRE